MAPAYYQTAWFRASCTLALIVFLWLLSQMRVRRIGAEMNARFDERLAERNRLAGELHDTILQTVQATKMIADHARYNHSTDPARMHQDMVSISDWLTQATAEARAALNALHTSIASRNDLSEAFQRAAESSNVTSAMKFVLSAEGAAKELHPIVRDEIYRIGCEAIRNAGAHSGASELHVNLQYANKLTLRVRDDGIGMEPHVAATGKPGHFGLRGMQSRAARIHGILRILSRPYCGTEVELVVPGRIAFRDTNPGRSKIYSRLQGLFTRPTPHGPTGKEPEIDRSDKHSHSQRG